jgi:hypothetical protein
VRVSWSTIGTAVAVCAALALWVARCSGPQPEVVGSASVTPPAQPGQPYVVAATVVNHGPGHGQVEVTFRLKDAATGQVYQRQEQVNLEPGEQSRVVGSIAAPEGSYAPEVEVQYPPG